MLFGLTFRDFLPQIVVDEFDRLLPRIEGYLLQQHHDDGSHEDVTADSVRVSGAADFEENVRAQSEGASEVEIGLITDLGGILPTGVRGIGLGGEHRWIVGTKTATPPGITNAQELGIWNVDNPGLAGPQVLRILWDTANARYLIGVGGLGQSVVLFEDATGRRAGDIHTNDLHALLGYYERGRSARLGEWTIEAWADSKFTGNVTGDADWGVDDPDEIVSYMLVGKTLTVNFNVLTSDIANSPTRLRIAVPGGFTTAKRMDTVCRYKDAGAAAWSVGSLFVEAGEQLIKIEKLDASAFTNTAADNTSVVGQITFEIQ